MNLIAKTYYIQSHEMLSKYLFEVEQKLSLSLSEIGTAGTKGQICSLTQLHYGQLKNRN